MYLPSKVRSRPGVKRDGTILEGDHYIDARWCRFQRGLPRKIGGYVSISPNLPERVYGINSFSANARQYLHLGSESLLTQRAVSNVGTIVGANDRTPAGLTPDAKNIWQMDSIVDIPNLSDTVVLCAHAAPNMDIDSTVDRDIYYGDITANTALAVSGQDPVSGGILVVGNHLVGFGSGGYVQWSAPNDVVSATADAAYVTQQKIVAGRRVRGGGVPAALLWSLDSLLQMTYTGAQAPAPLWDFDTVTEEISILSSRGVIEYNGVFYWPGVDCWYMYNGVVREVPNDMNVNFFFDNLNFAQRQKVFAYKVPRFGEIWWCFPYGDSEECNHAVILNVREGYWYDTPIDEGRTDGLYAKVYFKPFMTGATETMQGFDLWQHETGVNKVRAPAPNEPIVSYFQTHEVSLITQDQEPRNKSISVDFMEPDFIQVGDLSVTVHGRANSRAPYQVSAPKTLTPAAADAEEQVLRFKEQRRLLSFKFESNTLNGDYQMGEPIVHIQPNDGRITT